MTSDLSALLAPVTELARTAGDLVMSRYFDQLSGETVKGNPFDIVTEADKAVEALLVEALTAAYPDHHILGEEGGGQGASAHNAEYFWHLDPIDGTVNFAHSLPFFAISIGLANRNGDPLLGVVFNPATNELFAAIQGGTATLNGRPIRVAATDTLERAIFVSGYAPGKPDAQRVHLREWQHIIGKTRGLRRFGAIALELCYVACGRIDGLWERGINAWDITAGLAIVLAAGGAVSDYNGERSETLYSGREIIATNGALHLPLLALVREANAQV